MKVAVITRHAITNYGSLLQTIATQDVIENMGFECEIINYIRKDESYWRSEKTLLKNKEEWNNSFIKKYLYLALRTPESVIAGRRFSKERKKYLNLGKKCTSIDELSRTSFNADIYMTGSDQVWGPVADGSYDSSYCLSFVGSENKKISYASSFGKIDFSEKLKNYYKEWLSGYGSVSVREKSAVEILGKLKIKAEQVLDPTLLMDSNEWDKYAEPIKHKNYILVYQIHNNKRLDDYVKRIAEKKKVNIIRISPYLHQISRGGKFVWCPRVSKFLSYIKNANCLITDSFHGTAFAINYNVPFVEVLPNNNTETRNISILQMTGLQNRILQDIDNVELIQQKIEYDNVNENLSYERKKSLDTLKEMLNK